MSVQIARSDNAQQPFWYPGISLEAFAFHRRQNLVLLVGLFVGSVFLKALDQRTQNEHEIYLPRLMEAEPEMCCL